MVLDWTYIGIVLGSLQHKIGPIIEIYNLHMDLLWVSQIPIYGFVYTIIIYDKELYLAHNRILLIWYDNDYWSFYYHFEIPYGLF